MTDKLYACDWCCTVQYRSQEPARCYSGTCLNRNGVHAFTEVTTPPADMNAERWVAELRRWIGSHAVGPEADDSRESIYADPSDMELASATAACIMPTLDRLWDNAKCDPTIGPLVAAVRKVAKVLASATPPPAPALPTREAVAQALDDSRVFAPLKEMRLAQADAVIRLFEEANRGSAS